MSVADSQTVLRRYARTERLEFVHAVLLISRLPEHPAFDLGGFRQPPVDPHESDESVGPLTCPEHRGDTYPEPHDLMVYDTENHHHNDEEDVGRVKDL